MEIFAINGKPSCGVPFQKRRQLVGLLVEVVICSKFAVRSFGHQFYLIFEAANASQRQTLVGRNRDLLLVVVNRVWSTASKGCVQHQACHNRSLNCQRKGGSYSLSGIAVSWKCENYIECAQLSFWRFCNDCLTSYCEQMTKSGIKYYRIVAAKWI